jgi:hypothetical protein
MDIDRTQARNVERPLAKDQPERGHHEEIRLSRKQRLA